MIYGSGMRRIVIGLVIVIAVARTCTCRDDDRPPPLRIATFNIEDFPKSARQIDGAFAEIARLDAPIVAVQEITDPAIFVRAATERLGAPWRFAFADPANAPHHLGVLFDSRRVRHVATRIHDETRLDEGRHKPVLDVEFAAGRGRLRVLVVHFKAGGENQPIRHRQYAALARVVAEVRRSGARVIVLGDFNATGDADRADLERFARATGVTWVTEGLPCSAFWDRDDGCPRSRLDHVLATETARDVAAAGACADDGCAWQDRCPLYADEVSDHCPVVATFE